MDLERMKCGNCGSKTAEVFAARAAGPLDGFAAIELRCKCGTRTRFQIRALIMQDHHANPDSPGSHCIGWGG